MSSALGTASRLVARHGSVFTLEPSGPTFKAVQTYPGGSVRPETRSFLSTLRVDGDSPVDSGDVITSEVTGLSYLITAVTEKAQRETVTDSELTALKADALVTIQRIVAGAWAIVATNVACAILNQPMSDPSDKGMVVQGYRGTSPVAWGYFQSSVGLMQGDQVNDGSRTYLVSHDLNTTLMDGITIARLDLRT